MKSSDILSGDITVSGRGSIEIELTRQRPHAVVVEFKNNPIYVPCNPHHDHLGWEVYHKHGKFTLLIKWNVSGTRYVIWAVD